MSTVKRYVAFIDILGFKSIFDNFNNADELGDQMSVILLSSIRSALSGTNVEVDDDTDLNSISSIKVYQFSDSIVLYTEDDGKKSLSNFITALNLLFAQSMIRGFPLRGALTLGELYVKGSIVVGEPLINAYKIEYRQEWAGLIIDCNMPEQVLKELLDEQLVAYYNVSMKDIPNKSVVKERHLVLNWPQYCGAKISSEVELRRRFSMLSGEPVEDKDIAKRERTVTFFKENLGNKELPSFIFGTGRVVLMKNGHVGFAKD